MLITQEGEEDLKKHVKIHLADAHPDRRASDAEIHQAVKTV